MIHPLGLIAFSASRLRVYSGAVCFDQGDLIESATMGLNVAGHRSICMNYTCSSQHQTRASISSSFAVSAGSTFSIIFRMVSAAVMPLSPEIAALDFDHPPIRMMPDYTFN